MINNFYLDFFFLEILYRLNKYCPQDFTISSNIENESMAKFKKKKRMNGIIFVVDVDGHLPRGLLEKK